MGLFDQLFGGGQQAATDAAAQKVAGLQQAQKVADPLYDTANAAINTGYGAAQNLWSPVQAQGIAGANAYGDITGANGVLGQDRARALFQTDPGYQWQMAQALQATQRGQGTAGFQNSGNVETALQDRAANLAAQQYGNYVQRLQPFLGYNILGTQGAGNAFTGQGQALSANDISRAGLDANIQAGIGSANAAGTLGAAQARSGEIGQALGLGSRLLGFALAPATGGASLAGSNIGQLFGGGGGFGSGSTSSPSDPYGLGFGY